MHKARWTKNAPGTPYGAFRTTNNDPSVQGGGEQQTSTQTFRLSNDTEFVIYCTNPISAPLEYRLSQNPIGLRSRGAVVSM